MHLFSFVKRGVGEMRERGGKEVGREREGGGGGGGERGGPGRSECKRLDVPATYHCISGTDLLGQLYLLAR